MSQPSFDRSPINEDNEGQAEYDLAPQRVFVALEGRPEEAPKDDEQNVIFLVAIIAEKYGWDGDDRIWPVVNFVRCLQRQTGAKPGTLTESFERFQRSPDYSKLGM